MSARTSTPAAKLTGLAGLADALDRCASAGRTVSDARDRRGLQAAEAAFTQVRGEVVGAGAGVESRVDDIWRGAEPGLKAAFKAVPELLKSRHRLQHYLWYYLRPGGGPMPWPAVREPADLFLDPYRCHVDSVRIHAEAAGLARRLTELARGRGRPSHPADWPSWRAADQFLPAWHRDRPYAGVGDPPAMLRRFREFWVRAGEARGDKERTRLLSKSVRGRQDAAHRILRMEGEWLRDALAAGVWSTDAFQMYADLKAAVRRLGHVGPLGLASPRSRRGGRREGSWRTAGQLVPAEWSSEVDRLAERFDQVARLVTAQRGRAAGYDGPPVVLRGRGVSPLVFGRPVNPLGFVLYKLIEALIAAGDDGLSKADLNRIAGNDSGANYIFKLCRDNPTTWGRAISMPGTKGNRYRVLAGE